MQFLSNNHIYLIVLISLIFELVVADDCAAFNNALSTFTNSYGFNHVKEDFEKEKVSNCCEYSTVTCNSEKYITKIGFNNLHFDTFNNNVINELSKLKYLESLEIHHGKGFPNNIYLLKGLKSLKIIYPLKFGTVPDEIGQLTNLEELEISNVYANIQFPKCICKLTNLRRLSLESSNFEGYIPYECRNLTKLEELNLKFNKRIKGYVPPLPKLVTCDYSLTDICYLESTTCRSENYLKDCTKEDVLNANKLNGNPNPNSTDEYVEDDNDGKANGNPNPNNTNEYVGDDNDGKANRTVTLVIKKDSSKGSGSKSYIYIIIIIIAIVILIVKCCKKGSKPETKPTNTNNHNEDDEISSLSSSSSSSSSNEEYNVNNNTTPGNNNNNNNNNIGSIYISQEQPYPATSPPVAQNFLSGNTSMNTPIVGQSPLPPTSEIPASYPPAPAPLTETTGNHQVPLVSVPPPSVDINGVPIIPYGVPAVGPNVAPIAPYPMPASPYPTPAVGANGIPASPYPTPAVGTNGVPVGLPYPTQMPSPQPGYSYPYQPHPQQPRDVSDEK